MKISYPMESLPLCSLFLKMLICSLSSKLSFFKWIFYFIRETILCLPIWEWSIFLFAFFFDFLGFGKCSCVSTTSISYSLLHRGSFVSTLVLYSWPSDTYSWSFVTHSCVKMTLVIVFMPCSLVFSSGSCVAVTSTVGTDVSLIFSCSTRGVL